MRWLLTRYPILVVLLFLALVLLTSDNGRVDIAGGVLLLAVMIVGFRRLYREAMLEQWEPLEPRLQTLLRHPLRESRRLRQHKIGTELNWVNQQIKEIVEENKNLREIATKCARESAGKDDETCPTRMAARSRDIRDNSELLERLRNERERLERKFYRLSELTGEST